MKKYVIRILSRKNKNNPDDKFEPGVGKATIVEGLTELYVRRSRIITR